MWQVLKMIRKIPVVIAVAILSVFIAPILYVVVRSFEGGQYYELVINNYSYFK